MVAPGASVVDRFQVLCGMHRHAGFQSENAVQLPAAQELRYEIASSSVERQVVKPGRCGPVSLIRLTEAFLQPPFVWIVMPLRAAAGKRVEHGVRQSVGLDEGEPL